MHHIVLYTCYFKKVKKILWITIYDYDRDPAMGIPTLEF